MKSNVYTRPQFDVNAETTESISDSDQRIIGISHPILRGELENGAGFAHVDSIDQLPTSLLIIRNSNQAYLTVKRFFDFAFAFVLLALLLPLFFLIGLMVKLSSDGPILFTQERLGRNGKKFKCYKFRTMVRNAEAVLETSPALKQSYLEQGFKIKNDPRVTKIGAFLRKTSLDELPQLLNVLRGDISLIGPRPIVPSELEMYGRFSTKLLTAQPGLSGMWQACGRSDTTYAERVLMDMSYIDHRTIWLDLKLAILTIKSVSSGKGAH